MEKNTAKNLSKRTKKISRINNFLSKIIAPSLRERGYLISRIIINWQDIAGEAAAWSYPVNISFGTYENQEIGTLTLNVASGRAPEMQMHKSEIIIKCNQLFGYNAIAKINIIQQLPQ